MRKIIEKGYIYIFTNPSFPEYVKIGYAKNVEQRLNELNRSTAVPFSFRIYATYEVDSVLSDKKIHSILDKLNPELRSIEDINGKKRIREFYAMSPEDAYTILEAIAEINNYSSRLKKWKPTISECEDEQLAREISEISKDRAAPFSFYACNIPEGAELEFWKNSHTPTGIICRVAGDKKIEYNGKIYSLTSLAKELTGISHALPGPQYYKYKGEWINDIRTKLGV